MDEQNYLDPDFDPFTLRVADLRKILLLHNVPFSSTSKKQDLVDLFKKNIAANAAAILASQKKVKPSSRGILMVGDRKTSDMYNDSDDEQNSPVEAKKEKGRGKKPVKREESSTLDEEVFAVPAPKPKGRLSKKDTVKSEPDVVTSSEFDNPAVTTPQTPVTRRGRKKRTEVETPGLTDTDADDYSKTPRDKSPFSDHNPFQSGGEGTPEKSSRRKSGVSRRGRSTSRSRRSLMHVDSPSDFNTPITKSGYYSPGQPTPPKFGDTVEHPSAFPVTSPAALTTPTPILLHKFMSPPSVGTPDTDDLLEEKSPINPFVNAPVAEAEASTVSASSPGAKVRAGFKKKANRRTDGELVIEEYNWASVWVIVLLMLLANGVWWRHEKVKIGYCEMTNQESNNEVSHPLAFLYPKCIPCPAYAKCVGGQLVSCDDNFVRTRNPLSLGGLIPLSDWCEPDAEKQQRAVEVANELRRQLNIRAGEVECGHIKVNRSLSKAEAAGMKVDDAYKQLIALKDPSIADTLFIDYWNLALNDLRKHTDQVEFTSTTGGEYIVSREPYLPLSCRLRKNFIATLWKYKVELLGIASFVALLYFLQQKWVERKQNAKVVAGLVQAALIKLMDQEHYHYVDPVQFPYEGIPMAHLRDLLLSEEHSTKRRQYLWERVRRIVETNSNVRARMMEVKGEPHRMWEWVGGVTVKKEDPIYPSLSSGGPF